MTEPVLPPLKPIPIKDRVSIITKKQTLTALFRSMLHKLMTGQIRVKDLEFLTMSETGKPS